MTKKKRRIHESEGESEVNPEDDSNPDSDVDKWGVPFYKEKELKPVEPRVTRVHGKTATREVQRTNVYVPENFAAKRNKLTDNEREKLRLKREQRRRARYNSDMVVFFPHPPKDFHLLSSNDFKPLLPPGAVTQFFVPGTNTDLDALNKKIEARIKGNKKKTTVKMQRNLKTAKKEINKYCMFREQDEDKLKVFTDTLPDVVSQDHYCNWWELSLIHI